MLNAQTKNMDKLIGAMSSGTKETSPWHGMTIAEINEVKLPLNVNEWRASHVQAWLGLKLDLPQYLPTFQEASIDGLVLLKFITDDVLNDTLHVTNDLHRNKITQGINMLRQKQNEYDAKKRAELVAQEKKLQEEEEKMLKKKKTGKATAKTWFGDVREHNDIERVKLIREMKTLREKKEKQKKKMDDLGGTWKFEYTGVPKPVNIDDEIWNMSQQPGVTNTRNTQAFEKNMKTLLEFDDLVPVKTILYDPTKRTIPDDSGYDEVLAITKAAMFEVSNRLIEIEKINDKKNEFLNSDLDSIDGKNIPQFKNEIQDEDYFDEDEPPPYLAVTGGKATASLKNSAPVQKVYNRTELLFQAFIQQKNNGARWLGENEKLTRIKFHGGFESILRLKIPWPQFDVLWNHLDYRRSGELDKNEFIDFFGDFSDFEQANQNALEMLSDIMLELCNNLRYAGFSVLDTFSSFDRNGSGEVSVSEFCSMIRVVLGKHVDKKKIFRSFHLLDSDSSRSISCQEVMMFVYTVWKSQLSNLSKKLATLDEDIDKKLVQRILQERADIKEVIKKNFRREWRDHMERLGNQYSRGAFGNILKKMSISGDAASSSSITNTFEASNFNNSFQASPSIRPQSAGHTVGHQRSKTYGKNDILRMKIDPSRTHIPVREGAHLTVPSVTTMGNNDIASEGKALNYLNKTVPMNVRMYAPSSKK